MLSHLLKFREFPSFLGSKIFSRINEVLDEKIKWGIKTNQRLKIFL